MTRNDLIGLVLDNIDRPDILDTNPNQPGYWIKRAEQRIERELRMREMIVRRTVPLTSGFIELPSDFIQAENFALNDTTGARITKLEYATPQFLDDIKTRARACGLGPVPGVPGLFSVIGMQIELYPTPTDSVSGFPLYAVEMSYYPKLVPLVAGTDSNWLLENKTDIYVNAVTRYALEFTQEVQRASDMDNQLSVDIQILNMAKDIAISAGSLLVARTGKSFSTGGRR